MNVSLKQFISRRLIELVSKEMGYSFSNERIARIADQAIAIGHEIGNGGYATLWTTACAFETDLLLYGDPQATVKIVGFDLFQPILDEIYAEEPTNGPNKQD